MIKEAREKARKELEAVLAVGAILIVLGFPSVAVIAAVTYWSLRTRPDRLLAWSTAAMALPIAIGVLWQTDYAARWVAVALGWLQGSPPGADDWLAILAVGAAAGPVLGAVTWRITQRRREKSPYSGEDEQEKRRRVEEKRRRRTTQRAQALRHTSRSGLVKACAKPLSVPLGDEIGPYLGRYQRGDLDGPWRTGKAGGLVRVPLASGQARHLVVLGATGLGKTETTLGVCEWAAEQGYQVIYLSCKEPPDPGQAAAPRLAALADSKGLIFRSLISGYGPFDPMRGSTDDVRDRLVRIEEWGDRYWQHCANLLVGLALDLSKAQGKPIGTLPDLVYSLIKTRLQELSQHDPRVAELVAALEDRALGGALTRYASMALHLRDWVGPVDAGGWSFEDADVICAELPTGRRPEAAAALLRLMIRDFGSYLVTSRRQRTADGRRRPVLLVVEEAGAVAGDPVVGAGFVDLVERARSAGAQVVLTAQDPMGLGDERAVGAILTNAAVVTYRQASAAQAVAELAGTRRTDEGAALYDEGGWITKEGSTRRQHAMKISPQLLRELGPGECVVIGGGRYALVAATMTKLGYGLPSSWLVEAVTDRMLKAAEYSDWEDSKFEYQPEVRGREEPAIDPGEKSREDW